MAASKTHPLKVPRMARRWSLATLAIVVAAGLVARVAFRNRPDAPPILSTTIPDPALRSVLEQAESRVRLASRSGEAWGHLGMALQAGEFDRDASRCYAQAERLAPAEPRWPYLLGALLLKDEPDAAFVRFRRAVALAEPGTDGPRLRLAEGLAERGRLDEAEIEFSTLLQAQPDHAAALLGLAKVANARGQLEESRTLLHRCVKNPRTARGALTLLAAVERGLGNRPAADAAAISAARRPPDSAWPDPMLAAVEELRPGHAAQFEHGQRMLQEGRPGDALPLFARAAQERPGDAEAWLWLGRARLESKDCAGAEQALRRHLAVSPTSVNGHYQLGFALLCLERPADAAVEFGRAVERKPDFGEAHCILGFAQARAGRRTEAMQSLRQAIRYSPEFIESYLTLGELLLQTGERTEALPLLQRARELDPADERGKFLLEKAQGGRGPGGPAPAQ